MTLHVLHAGDGYTYLTRSVASGDVTRPAGDALAGYYTAQGNPPGVWAGSGIGDLGMSGVVTEEHMLALFGEGLRPDAHEFIDAHIQAGTPFRQALAAARLGRRFYQYDKQVPLVAAVTAAYRQFETDHDRRPDVAERREIKTAIARRLLREQLGGRDPTRDEVRGFLTDELGKARQPVAGMDLVFTAAKTAQMLLLDDQTRPVFLRVHEQAWRHALAYGEREAAFTRVGKNGIAQVRVHGFVATAFTHWDSRAGDPNLHTHVAISNRVLADDGIWRTVDSKQLHAIAVSMSEMYNALVEQGLTAELGVSWVEVSKGPTKRPTREIDGIPEEWARGFSRRRSDIETRYDELIAEYVRVNGRTPPRTVQIRLAQQATLDTRPDKEELHSLAELVAQWRATASRLLPGMSIRAVIQSCLHRADGAAADDVDLAQVAATVIGVVSTDRSTWNVYHVRAEATRQLKPVAYPSAQARQQAIEDVVRRALHRESFPLSVELDALPTLLQREEGESVFHRHGSDLFTCQAILDAETRLVDAAHTRAGPVVTRRALTAALRLFERGSDKTLNPGQRALVEHFVTSGMALARAVGPPGAGKSTAMKAVAQAWDSTGGRVIGLAPSAAAASVLGDELGVPADTLHSLIHKHQTGGEIDVQPGDMLLIDESGMAGTRMVDQVRQIAAEHDAVLRVIGDHRQLPAVEAGGWFRLLDVVGVPGIELTEVHRFVRDDEAEAMLAFRVGDEAAIGWYEHNGRLVGGAAAAVLDRLYGDWQADLDAGRTAIMISDSTQIARELSARAQLDRRAAGLVEAGGVELHDDSVAGVGDRVVTRLNRRRLAVNGGRDYVKNGDLWQVEKRYRDGRLRVRHIRHCGAITLPAWYVAEFVELGYAATVHRSQGLTVDIARSFLTPTAYRESALVALSRGIEGNYAYLDTEQMLHPDEPQPLPGDLFYRNRETSDEAHALTMIVRREGAERSATEELRDALDAPYRLDTAVPQFDYALDVYRGEDALRQAEGWVRAAVPAHADAVLADDAWPALAAVLHEVRDAGVDPARLLAHRAAQRALVDDPTDPARSVAQVLHFRVVADMPAPRPGPDRPDLLPGWVATPPTQDDDAATRVRLPASMAADTVEVGAWLRQRAAQIAGRVHVLGERAADTEPAWVEDLGEVPDDPAGREVWIVRAGQVAAYRERFRFDDTVETLLPGGQRGEQVRARAWVLAFLAEHPMPPAPPTAPPQPSAGDRLAARTAVLRHRLSSLADQLGRGDSAAGTSGSTVPLDPGTDPGTETDAATDAEADPDAGPDPI